MTSQSDDQPTDDEIPPPLAPMATTESKMMGQEVLGTWTLDDSHRLVATKYSPERYSQVFLDQKKSPDKQGKASFHNPSPEKGAIIDPKLRFSEPYHTSYDLDRLGTPADRQRLLRDMLGNAVAIPYSVSKLIDAWASGRIDFSFISSLPLPEQEVALGLKYDQAQLNNDSHTSPFHFCRLYYYAAARSYFVITGRIRFDDPVAESTPQYPFIDPFTIENFRLTEVPSKEFQPGDGRKQQGVLGLGLRGNTGDVRQQSVRWTFPYNDTFYLGAVQFSRAVYVASKRSPANMARTDGSGALTVMGREVAIILGSGAYSLHSTSWGEVLVPRGPPPGKKYGIKELSEAVKRYTLEPNYQKSLTWLSDLTPSLEPGEVVVTDSESLIDGQWVKSWEVGMPQGRS